MASATMSECETRKSVKIMQDICEQGYYKYALEDFICDTPFNEELKKELSQALQNSLDILWEASIKMQDNECEGMTDYKFERIYLEWISNDNNASEKSLNGTISYDYNKDKFEFIGANETAGKHIIIKFDKKDNPIDFYYSDSLKTKGSKIFALSLSKHDYTELKTWTKLGKNIFKSNRVTFDEKNQKMISEETRFANSVARDDIADFTCRLLTNVYNRVHKNKEKPRI